MAFQHAKTSYFRKGTRDDTLPCEHPSSRLSTNKSSATAVVDDEIVAEQFTRNVQFFGVESQKKSRRGVRRCHWTWWSREPLCTHAPTLRRFAFASC